MKKVGKLLVAMAVSVGAFSGAAQAQELITLLPNLLNEHNLIRAAEASRNESRHLESVSLGEWLPRLDFSADGGKERIYKVDESVSNSYRNYEEVRLTQLVTDFGVTGGAIDRAELVTSRSMTNLEAVRQNVLLRGISSYLNVVMAREKLRYAKQSEENISTQTGMEETLVSKGAGLSSDILQTKSQLARARALRVSVEGELVQAVNFFKAIYGFVPTEDDISSFRLPADPASLLPDGVEAMVKRAMENNPDIRIITLEGEIAAKEEKINRARYLPRINLFAKDNRREDDLGVDGIREERAYGVELTANLFRGGSDYAAVQASIEKSNSLQSQLNDTKRIVEGKVRNAWQSLQTSREKHEYLRNQADIIEEFLVLARKERKLGTRSLIDVLTGEVDQINAESQAVTSEIETLLASFDLYYAMGDLTADVVRTR